MPNDVLNQQGIVQLRPEDSFNMTQGNGRQMRMPVQVLLDYLTDMVKNLRSAVFYVFNMGTRLDNPILYTGSATTNAQGQAVFYLTDDGTANGNALYKNVTMSVAAANEANGAYGYTYALSADRKTLTVTVMRTGNAVTLLGISVLGALVAATGTPVRVITTGN